MKSKIKINSWLVVPVMLFLCSCNPHQQEVKNESSKSDTAKTMQGAALVKEKPLFIYRLTVNEAYKNSNKWDASINKIIDSQCSFLDNLGEKNILILAGRTTVSIDDKNQFGIAIIQADNIEEARKIMSEDPSVQNKIMQSEVFPFSMGIRHFKNVLQ